MECLHCQGRLVKGTAPFSIDRGGSHLHWDAVPAFHPCAGAALGTPVYTQCGEPLFEEYEVDVIQEAIRSLDRENEKASRRSVVSVVPLQPFPARCLCRATDGKATCDESEET